MLIIFDYFGVIAQDHFWYAAQDIAAGRYKSADMQELNREVNIGDITWADFCRRVAEDIGESLDTVQAGYQKHKITPHIVELISDIKQAGHGVVLLSNASSEYLRPIMKKLGLDTLFDEVFVSSDIGFSKPDRRAYLHVLKALHTDPHEALMIDDNATNARAAAEMGMQTITFDGVVNCRKALQVLGLI